MEPNKDNPYTKQPEHTPAPYQPQQPPPGHYMKPGRGGLILAFGILGLMVCVIFGICAWVMGKNDLDEMAAGTMDPTEHGMTNAGKILGMVGSILGLVGLALGILWLIFVLVMVGGASAYG